MIRDNDEMLVRALREADLVNPDTSDEALRAVFSEARREHDALPAGQQDFNSPHERVRVFLHPYLSKKGRKWAIPLDSLTLPDDPTRNSAGRGPRPSKEPWWRFW